MKYRSLGYRRKLLCLPLWKGECWQYNKTALLTMVEFFYCTVLVGCGGKSDKGSSGSNGKIPTIGDIIESITLLGIGGKDIKVIVAEIKELKMVNRDVMSISSTGEESVQNVSGGLLDELLKKHGISQTELANIRITAVDGYSMEIPSEILKNRDIILAYEIGGEPLFEESKPIRIVVPEERSMYWIRNVSKIEIAEGEIAESEQVEKVLIFDATIENLDKHDYERYEEINKAIKISNLLNEFVPKSGGQVFIKASDGLQRNETRETFEDAFIRITGKESPMFISPDIPKGMHVKNMLWFSSEKVAFLTMDKALETYSKSTGDIGGVSLKEALEDVGLKQGDTYIFTATDGYSIEMSKDDIDKGILYKKDYGSARISFEGLDKSTTVKDLLSIEVK